MLVENLLDLGRSIMFVWQHIIHKQGTRHAAAGAAESAYEIPNFFLCNDVPPALAVPVKFTATRKTGGRHRENFDGWSYNRHVVSVSPVV